MIVPARNLPGLPDGLPDAGVESPRPDFSLALEEARRTFDALSAELPALRSRATQVLGVGGLAASFLGGIALRGEQRLGSWGWVAVAAFTATAVLCLVILWPRRFYASPQPAQLVEWAERPDATTVEMTRDLALHMGEKYDANRTQLDRLSRFYCGAVVTLCAEIAAFIIDLWRT